MVQYKCHVYDVTAYRTCADYQSIGVAEGYAWIDPDGAGGSPPVYVQCSYSSETVTFTHSYPYTVPNYRGYIYNYRDTWADPLSWMSSVTYSPNTVEDMASFLTTNAKTASQTVTYL